jgi:ribonuclease J
MTTPTVSQPQLQVIPIGGMGEIGKNLLAYRYQDEILLIDGGLAFPDANHLGVDLVLPNIEYLIEHAHLIKGWVITHAHEDHIGGLPYAVARLPRIPMYAAPLAIGLIREKYKEFGIHERDVDLRETSPDETVRIGTHFVVDRFRMTHSIPENSGYVLHTPVGQVVHTGDFKLDPSPADGQTSNLARIEQAGRDGVLLLISDSTSAERPGWSMSEAEVAQNIDAIVKNATGRVFLTTFASHAHRLQNVIRIAEKYGRRVVIEGRSMVKYAQVAQATGHMQVKDPILTADDVGQLQDAQVLYLCTGSQGQPMAVLARLAFGIHSKLALKRGDSVILSSSPIPGNEEAVNLVINALYERGVSVYDPPNHRVHASGHGSQDELLTVFNLARPKFFLPWHGEPRHQVNHARLVQRGSRPPKRTIVARNGDIVSVGPDTFEVTGTVPANIVFVDGLGIGDVDEITLEERAQIGQEGALMVTALLHPEPHIALISRGFTRGRELEHALKQAAQDVLERGVRAGASPEELVEELHGAVQNRVHELTGRSPVVLPQVIV